MSADAKWYVVHTYSGYENKVATNIEKMVENRKMQDQILEVQIPTEIVTEIKDDKKREVERKLFPGYVLVKAAVTYDENNVPLYERRRMVRDQKYQRRDRIRRPREQGYSALR